eukprot:Tbor_TRINITY_DN4537_c0_g1::TRINITY_DN4537_c0_g1_i1::g.15782::m.15782
MLHMSTDLKRQNEELMESNQKTKDELNRTLMSYKALSAKYDDLVNQRNIFSDMKSPSREAHTELSHMSTTRKLLSDSEPAAAEWIPAKKVFMDTDNGIESINKRKEEILEQSYHSPQMKNRDKSPNDESVAVFCSVLQRSKARRGLSASPSYNSAFSHSHERIESYSPHHPNTRTTYEPFDSTLNQFSLGNTFGNIEVSPNPAGRGRELPSQTTVAPYGIHNTSHDNTGHKMAHWEMRVANEAREAVMAAEGYKSEHIVHGAVSPPPHTYRDDSRGRSMAEGVPLYRPYMNGEEARIKAAGDSSLEWKTK